MEDFISNNMEELCRITDPSESFLDFLLMKKVITDGKHSDIVKKNGNLSKNMALFTFLQTSRTDDDLNDIISALKTSGNARALKLFQKLTNETQIDLERGSVSNTEPPPQQTEMVTRSGDELDACRLVEIYPSTGKKMALIINVLKNRRGAENDTTALNETLRRCGFDVVLCQRFTEEGVLATIQEFKSNLTGVSCCLVAVMSHGVGMYDFLTEDDVDLNFKKVVVNQFNNARCRELKNIPKVFLANFCRGDKVDTCKDSGIKSDDTSSQKNSSDGCTDAGSFVETDSTGTYSDMILCHGTYDDHYAYRTVKGTWFIQNFCKILKTRANGNTDFKEIMDLVFDKVNEEETEYGAKQCPTYECTGFTKKLYLKYD